MRPVKKINEVADMEAFGSSPAKREINGIIESLARSVSGCEVPASGYTTDNTLVNGVVNKLDRASEIVDRVPPLEQRQRFGNPAFRDWLAQATEVLNSGDDELDYYLSQAFGSVQRMDYGTGHELNFIAYWGGVLKKEHLKTGSAGKIKGTDVLFLFSKYFNLCRKIFLTYKLEPAGSHGVWGLDDHFHLPYILGAAQLSQLLPDESPKPSDTLNQRAIAEYKHVNLYFWALSFINEMKTGPFFEHSPMLYDISDVKSWSKIKSGLIKMYNGEVLSKFPVVQHFYFGSLYPFSD